MPSQSASGFLASPLMRGCHLVYVSMDDMTVTSVGGMSKSGSHAVAVEPRSPRV